MPLHLEQSGTGPRLVLVHGFTQTGRSWGPIASNLGRDHEVVAVDAPGHGGSAAVRVGLVDGAHLLGAVGGRATYVGYSMGGRLALHLTLAEPALVERLVLIGAAAGIEDPGERAARRAADEDLAADLERFGLDAFLDRWLAGPLFTTLPDDQADRAERLRNTPAALASSLRLAGTGTQDPLWDRLPEIGAPVLLLAGELDAKFRAVAERMARAIGANAQTAIVPAAGHAAHLEHPAAFLAILRRWLAETSGPAGRARLLSPEL